MFDAFKKVDEIRSLDKSKNEFGPPNRRSKHGRFFRKIVDKLTISTINRDFLPIFC